VHPGRSLAKKVYSYCKKNHPKTKIMVSGIRSREDALSVAGADFIVLGSKVLKQLNEVPTAEGYNSDLTATGGMQSLGVEAQLHENIGLEDDNELPLEKVTKEHFQDCLGYAGREMMSQVIHPFLIFSLMLGV